MDEEIKVCTKSKQNFLNKLFHRLSTFMQKSQSNMMQNSAQSQGAKETLHNAKPKRKITPEALKLFCGQLEKFMKYVHNIHRYAYCYPSALQKRIEVSANELQFLYLEICDALTNINRLKRQNKAVKKETTHVLKTLKKLRDDEINEMETIILKYDKFMYNCWKNVKTTHQAELVELLLADTQNKQEALNCLQKLVSWKLDQLQTSLCLPMDAMHNATDSTKATANPFRRRFLDTSPRASHRAVRRRRAADRFDTSPVVQQQPSVNNLQLVPFSHPPPPLPPPLITPASFYNQLLNSSTPTTSHNYLAGPTLTLEPNESHHHGFHADMTSVIHALFTDFDHNSNTSTVAESPTSDTNLQLHNFNGM